MTHNQAYKSARKSANKTQEIHIVYYDPDYQSFGRVSLSIWEIWIDNGEVTDMELRDVVYPQSPA